MPGQCSRSHIAVSYNQRNATPLSTHNQPCSCSPPPTQRESYHTAHTNTHTQAHKHIHSIEECFIGVFVHANMLAAQVRVKLESMLQYTRKQTATATYTHANRIDGTACARGGCTAKIEPRHSALVRESSSQ